MARRVNLSRTAGDGDQARSAWWGEGLRSLDPHPARYTLATLTRPHPNPPPLAEEGRVGACAGEGLPAGRVDSREKLGGFSPRVLWRTSAGKPASFASVCCLDSGRSPR